ncbi:MAG: phosphoadenylyl-sulfate reductase [Sulfitobacter sp.]
MLLDPPQLHPSENTPPGGSDSIDARNSHVAALNAGLRHHSAADVLRAALADIDNLALVSSFGAESVALLHMVSVINRDLPVIFIDTELLFTETLVYQHEVSERLGLRNISIVRARNIAAGDPDGTLRDTDANACCHLRKTAPLTAALQGYDGWITGRKRFQSGTRAALEFFEYDAVTGRIKVNPLAHWTPADVAEYIAENRLPRHPLVAKGYPSIGCAPCTSPVAKGEAPRAGRWRATDKDECGIHFENGKMIRTGANT